MTTRKRRAVGSNNIVSEAVDVENKDFFNMEAQSAFRGMLSRKVIQERGMICKPPFEPYIRCHSWENFARNPVVANITMASEFYANMRFIDKEGDVLCRGNLVRITPTIINEYYQLRSDNDFDSEFKKLKSEACVDDDGQLVGNWTEMVREITQPHYSMGQILPKKNWGHIDKKFLSMDMNMWYSFVVARLMPVTINSEVQWERIRLMFAIKKNMAINVGSVIYISMQNMNATTSCLGFHSLITGLCHRAGCENRIDDTCKAPMGMLTSEAFKRRLKAPIQHPQKFGSEEYVVPTDEGVSSRLERIEEEVRYVRSIAEHTAKIIARAFPDSIAAVGSYPGGEVQEEQLKE